jgi:POT family proton-dependent oligopeptide transporter
MAFDVTFLIALACLLAGVGCFKGNLASQVGALYGTTDNRRADAFQIYYLFINGGVIAAPLIAGTLGEVYGWHYGFGAAGVGMLIGLTIYLRGRKWLPPDSPIVEKSKGAAKIPLTHREKMGIIALLALLPVLTIAVIGNQQIFNAYLVWAEKTANLVCFGKKMPTTWLITLDSILSVSYLAGAVVFWRLWSKKFPEPAEITKLGIGSLIAVSGFLSLAAGAIIAASSGGSVSIGWLITFHLLNSIGFANVFPASLALYARVAPPALSATIIGIYYLAFFAANNLVGWLGGFLEKMPAIYFWLLHAALLWNRRHHLSHRRPPLRPSPCPRRKRKRRVALRRRIYQAQALRAGGSDRKIAATWFAAISKRPGRLPCALRHSLGQVPPGQTCIRMQLREADRTGPKRHRVQRRGLS